jgi:hypothetical protein
LSEQQIDKCIAAWAVLCGDHPRALDTSEAMEHGSRTRFVQDRQIVMLGADAYPGSGISANSRMSMLACLAHELAHAERFEVGYSRPFDAPDSFIDEAETSLRASFTSVLSPRDREDLVEDARDRLIDWLAARNKGY